jgi:hypothetical protein
MSEIVKSSVNGISSPSSNRKGRKRKEQPIDAKPLQISHANPLVDSAIVAADASFQEATEAYNARVQANLAQFAEHINGTTMQVSGLIVSACEKAYGYDPQELYSPDSQPDADEY